jgi:3-phosphoshikimate 1-carboxyvinyltransferase
LPCLAVAACFAEGETRLVNVPQARLKETDRISVMRDELAKLGADIFELPDGLVIRKSKLTGGAVNARADHRVVMALSVAGLACEKEVVVDTAEASNVTFPDFFALMKSVGAKIEKEG